MVIHALELLHHLKNGVNGFIPVILTALCDYWNMNRRIRMVSSNPIPIMVVSTEDPP